VNKKLLLILSLLPLISNAQLVSDAKLWAGISVNKKINNLEISFSEEIRMDENASHVDKFFSELGAEYKVLKGFYVALNYRYSRDNDYESKNYDMKHRIDFGLTYKRKFNNLGASFRTKIQTKNGTPGENNPTFSRNKFLVKYKLENKLTPFIAYEFYFQFNEEKVINRTRLSLGSSYKLNKKNSIKAFYMFESKFNVKNLKHNHIYGISYSIDL
jgi:predicted porin